MKTTLNLPDPLLEAVRKRASAEGRTQTSLVEEALRKLLAEKPSASQRPMPTFGAHGSNGLLLELEDRDALYAALEAGNTAAPDTDATGRVR